MTTNKELMKLKPDYDAYFAAEKAEKTLIIGAFSGETLIGYSVNFVIKNLHYSDLIMCQNDLLYLDPEYRKGITGIRLLRETEKRAKALGANFVAWHAKPDTVLDQVLTRLKYKVQDIIYTKEI